ncbi:MAG: antitoxin [Dermatophilaceae bacterium]
MGLLDNIKDKASELVDQHGDQVGGGVDKAGDFVDEKTGGKFSDQIDGGQRQAKDGLDGLDGQDDDIS